MGTRYGTSLYDISLIFFLLLLPPGKGPGSTLNVVGLAGLVMTGKTGLGLG